MNHDACCATGSTHLMSGPVCCLYDGSFQGPARILRKRVKMTSTHNPFLTTAEAADYLRLSRQFLEIARHRGDGPPYIKLSRAVRYHRPSLDQWMLERQRNHSAEGEA